MSKPCLLAVWIGLVPLTAFPSETAILVAQEGCDALDLGEIRRLLTIELADIHEGPFRSENLEIRLVCEGESVRISASDQTTATRIERSIDTLRANLKERVIALSVSQLVTAARLDESAKAGEPDAADAPGKAEDSVVDHVELSLAGGLKLHADLALPTGVAVLVGDVWFRPDLGLRALVSFEAGTAHRDIGSATPLCGLAGLGLGWRFLRTGPFRLETNASALAGYAHIHGNARQGAAGSAVGGITGEFEAGLTPSVHFDRVFVALDLQGGYTIENPIGRVENEAPVTLGGFWAGAAVRFGFHL